MVLHFPFVTIHEIIRHFHLNQCWKTLYFQVAAAGPVPAPPKEEEELELTGIPERQLGDEDVLNANDSPRKKSKL